MERCDGPGHSASPIVPHEVKPSGSEKIRETQHVSHKFGSRIFLDAFGARSRRIPTLIDRDGMKTQRSHRLKYGCLGICKLRKSMQKENQVAGLRPGRKPIESKTVDRQRNLFHRVLPTR